MLTPNANFKHYADGRPEARWRMDARDRGIIFHHGRGPNGCDAHGARDLWIYQHQGAYYLHYDGAGPDGWICCLATSTDLVHWQRHGPRFPLGDAGAHDSRGAIYGVTIREADDDWHMFYLGTQRSDPRRHYYLQPPYVTLKACANHPAGPWRKQYDVVPFVPQPGSYYDWAASPGQVVRHDGEYLMFFNATRLQREPVRKAFRTLGLARTHDLNGAWELLPDPILPDTENIENASVYHQQSDGMWFLFTNHVAQNHRGLPGPVEYTEAAWVYWTRDPFKWDANNKAVVLDNTNIHGGQEVVGLPTVLPIGDRLGVFYDTPASRELDDNHHNIGVAWLDLPLDVAHADNAAQT